MKLPKTSMETMAPATLRNLKTSQQRSGVRSQEPTIVKPSGMKRQSSHMVSTQLPSSIKGQKRSITESQLSDQDTPPSTSRKRVTGTQANDEVIDPSDPSPSTQTSLMQGMLNSPTHSGLVLHLALPTMRTMARTLGNVLDILNLIAKVDQLATEVDGEIVGVDFSFKDSRISDSNLDEEEEYLSGLDDPENHGTTTPHSEDDVNIRQAQYVSRSGPIVEEPASQDTDRDSQISGDRLSDFEEADEEDIADNVLDNYIDEDPAPPRP